jgi:hypothetical protein
MEEFPQAAVNRGTCQICRISVIAPDNPCNRRPVLSSISSTLLARRFQEEAAVGAAGAVDRASEAAASAEAVASVEEAAEGVAAEGVVEVSARTTHAVP